MPVGPRASCSIMYMVRCAVLWPQPCQLHATACWAATWAVKTVPGPPAPPCLQVTGTQAVLNVYSNQQGNIVLDRRSLNDECTEAELVQRCASRCAVAALSCPLPTL